MPSLSESVIRQALSDDTGERLLMQEINRVNKIEAEKKTLLGDPKKLDAMAAQIATDFSPVVIKPKNLSKYTSQAEGVQSNIPEDHPFSTIGSELRGRLQSTLNDPKLRGKSVAEVIQAVTNQYIFEPVDESGISRLEQAYKYKRERDAELKLGLNPFGEDLSFRKPPGYDQWHEAVRQAEDVGLASESYFANWDDLKTAALWGGAIGGTIGAFTGPLGVVVEGGIAAAASPILEAIAHPVRRAIEGSEWYRSKISSDSGYEKLKAEAFKIGTDIGLGFAGWGAGSRTLRKGLRAAAEAGKISEESISKFLKSGKALDAVKAGESSFLAKKATARAEIELENIARDDVYESASDAITAIRKARGQDVSPEEALLKSREGILKKKRENFVDVLNRIKQQREQGKPLSDVKTDIAEPKVSKAKAKSKFSELTHPGAEKALNKGAETGNLNEAINQVHQDESVVKKVVKREASDYVELLTGKEKTGKKIYATDKARAVLQGAGYNVEEISGFGRKKLLRLASEASRENKGPVKNSAIDIVIEESKLPIELTPDAQGIIANPPEAVGANLGLDYLGISGTEKKPIFTFHDPVTKSSVSVLDLKDLPGALDKSRATMGVKISAEEAIKRSDQEIAAIVPEAESAGYLAAMLEAGKIKAAKLSHEGPITSSRAIDLEAIPKGERAIPQETLIDDFIYDKLDEQFAKKYKKQFRYWLASEHYPEVKPVKSIQKEIQSQYEFLQKKYGYDLKVMVPSKKRAILKYADREGYEQIEFDDEVKKIRSMFDGKKLLGAAGIAIIAGLADPLLSLLSPKEAQAAGFDSAARVVPKVFSGLLKKAAGASEEVKVAFMSGIREAGYLPGEIKQGTKTVSMDYFGRQMHILENAKAAGLGTSDLIQRTKGIAFGLHNMMSPAGVANLAYKTGYSVAIQRAHLQTLWAVHTRDITRMVDNILSDVPGFKSSADEIAKITAPFVDEYPEVQAIRAMEARLEQTNSAIDRLYKKSLGKGVGPKKLAEYDQAINKAELGRDLLKKEVERLTPFLDDFNKRFDLVEQDIAKKFSSARIFYAAEDTADFSKRPWLRGLVSYDEEVAAGHIKDLMETYALRMLEGHHKVITDSPYMYHALHPKYSTEKAKEFLDSLGININTDAAFTKFFKRAKYSKAFIPDVQYALNKYIPDAEKRILISDFWRKTGPKDYRKIGWYSHMRTPAVQYNQLLSGFWNRMWTADEPEMRTVGNRIANWYTAFESFALIGFSPATAFKHVFKNEGTAAQLGLINTFLHYPDAIGTASRNWLSSGPVQDGIVMRGFRKLGVNTTKDRRVLDKFADAMTHQYRLMHHMSDMHLPDIDPGVTNKIDKFLFKIGQKGSAFIGAVESMDRAHSFHAALDMALNKGLTEQQALYGIFDTILKNNFLGGGLNPQWMRNPKIRALFLFQNTPFKIMERRLVNGIKTYQSVKTAIGIVKKQDLQKTLRELRDMGRFIKEGSDSLKENLIKDAIFSERDIFGTPYTKQFMRDFIYTGAIIYGAGSLFNADFVPHTFHVPFISTFGGDRPQLGVSPLANAVYRGLTRKRNSIDETGQEIGWVPQFFQDWLGRRQFIPQTFYKLNRISEGDIPERYKDSRFRYMFSLPTQE